MSKYLLLTSALAGQPAEREREIREKASLLSPPLSVGGEY